MSHLETIDLSLLVTVSGGQAAQQPQQPTEEAEPQRTWGQIGREYAAACVQGAGQSLVFGGRPRSAREGLTNAAVGCAMGVGMKAVDEAAGLLTR